MLFVLFGPHRYVECSLRARSFHPSEKVARYCARHRATRWGGLREILSSEPEERKPPFALRSVANIQFKLSTETLIQGASHSAISLLCVDAL
jgi:hypothetical protein